MAKVVGLKSSSGEYQGTPYSNVMVHCTYKDKNISGEGAIVYKVKSDLFANNPVKIGDEVEAMYNRYGNVTELRKL